MPPTKSSNNDSISIELLDPSVPSFPGSVIRGRVVRNAPIDTTSATCTVCARLQGRAKAKLVVDNGNSKSVYRSRFPFWNDADVADVVHDGPVSSSSSSSSGGGGGGEESLSWQFSLRIPTDVDEKAVNSSSSEKERKHCYLYVPRTTVGGAEGEVRVTGQPLPGTFHYSHRGFGKKWHGYVEFWIEADITVNAAGRNRPKVFRATLPIRVNSRPSQGPITGFEPTTRKFPRCVSSYRFVPGMEQGQLSLREKTRKFFGSSKVPSLNFTLELSCPTVIQPGNPSTIPFTLRAVPNWEKTSQAIANVPQTMLIMDFEFKVETTTSVVCPGLLSAHSGSKSRTMLLAKKTWVSSSDSEPAAEEEQEEEEEQRELELLCGPDDKPLDLGAALGVKIDASGRVVKTGTYKSVVGAASEPTLEPTYTTYCIKVEHVLLLDMSVLVGGETLRFSGRQNVRVLTPSIGVAGGENGVGEEDEAVSGAVLGFMATGVDVVSTSLDVFGAISDLVDLIDA